MSPGDIAGLIAVITLVAVPALAISARIALQPIVGAILRVREAFTNGQPNGATDQRVTELEVAVHKVEQEVKRLAEIESFHNQLHSGPRVEPEAGGDH